MAIQYESRAAIDPRSFQVQYLGKNHRSQSVRPIQLSKTHFVPNRGPTNLPAQLDSQPESLKQPKFMRDD